MSIVCGTDLSTAAGHAAEVAACMAQRLQLPLMLVHVLDELGAELAVATQQDAMYEPVREQVRAQAAALAERFQVRVEPMVVAGHAQETLSDIAAQAEARMLVIASLGRSKQHRWLLGSVAERVAQLAAVPVLVVRDSAALLPWLRGERELRALVGVELDSSSRAALEWASALRELGRCDLRATQVASAHAHGPLASSTADIDREAMLRSLRSWARVFAPDGDTDYAVRPAAGPVDRHLALLAAESKVDLLVVGRHERTRAARFWERSVSRGVLHHASCNVACVPHGQAPRR